MKSHQKDMIKNFREFTSCKEDTAENFLKQTNWDFNTAINMYFEQGYVEPVQNSVGLFEAYKGTNGKIQAEGIVKLFSDIGLNASDPICGYLMYIMRALNDSQLSQEQFGRLCNYVEGNTIDKIKASMPNIKEQFKSEVVFKEVYNYLFDLYKDNPKFIKFQVAMALWQLYFDGRFHFYNEFLKYMETYNKSISKDLWKMIYQFELEFKGNINNYKNEDGWPSIIDDFVQELKK